MKTYWFAEFFLILGLVSASIPFNLPNIQENTSLFQTGTVQLSLYDLVISHCITQPLNLPANLSKYTSVASFENIAQERGVKFGLKSFSVDSLYNQQNHELSIMVSIYGKFQWKTAYIIYFVSSDSEILTYKYSLQLWNPLSCNNEIGLTKSQMLIDVPHRKNIQALVFIRGVVCKANSCIFRLNKYYIQEQTLKIDYQYSIEQGLIAQQYPTAIHLGYILFTDKADFYVTTILNPYHTYLKSVDQKHSNKVDPSFEKQQLQKYDSDVQVIKSLVRVDEKLNYYQLTFLEKRSYLMIQEKVGQQVNYIRTSHNQCFEQYNGTVLQMNQANFCII